MIKRISSDEARGLLSESRVGRLGCVIDDGQSSVIVFRIRVEEITGVGEVPL